MIVRSAGRGGLTLMEVILAMAIFLMSLVALNQLLAIATESALNVKWQTKTSLRCQSKLNEIMIGVESLQGGGDYAGFSDDPMLMWKMESTPADSANLLYTVKVSVKVDLPGGKTIESQLVQMVFDPMQRGSTMDQPNPTPAGTPTTDSTTPSSGSSTPASGGAAAAPASAKGKTATKAGGGATPAAGMGAGGKTGGTTKTGGGGGAGATKTGGAAGGGGAGGGAGKTGGAGAGGAGGGRGAGAGGGGGAGGAPKGG